MRVAKSHPLVCCANLSKGKTLKASVWMHKLNGEAACIAFQMVMARARAEPLKGTDEREEEHLCGCN